MLIPLLDTPDRDPSSWTEAQARGPGAIAVLTTAPDQPASVQRLARAGACPLGLVSLGYATRPLAEVLAEVNQWAAAGVQGIFFDHAPAGPYQVGPVAHAVRAARRLGLGTLVLNAGVAVDPVYRGLGATIGSFEDTWLEYRKRSGDEFPAGDAHLVLDVPVHELPYARAMVLARGADLLLVTERAEAFRPTYVHNG